MRNSGTDAATLPWDGSDAVSELRLGRQKDKGKFEEENKTGLEQCPRTKWVRGKS